MTRKEKKPVTGEPLRVTGEVFSGLGEAASFLRVPWVIREIQRVLGFTPAPGTLNLRVVAEEERRVWEQLHRRGGMPIMLPPGEPCGARLIPVLVAGKVPGGVVIPDISRYGADVVEVIAPVNIRDTLHLRDGDPLTLDVSPLP